MNGRFWTKAWSLIGGCTPAIGSENLGCRFCWLRKEYNMRKKHPNSKIRALYEGFTDEHGHWNGTVTFRADRLELPLHWKKPQVVMILSDLYHPGIRTIDVLRAWDIMSKCKQHIFLVITKRVKEAVILSNVGGGIKFPSNVYHLITCENQARADERLPYALQIPGKVVILAEPLLGPIDLGYPCFDGSESFSALGGIKGVITGGETGPGARPTRPDWFRSLRDQCHMAGVPFMFKGWGDYIENGCALPGHPMKEAGWSRKGRLLDEQEHNEVAWRVAK